MMVIILLIFCDYCNACDDNFHDNDCDVGWLVVLGFNATLTAKVISWRSATHQSFHNYRTSRVQKMLYLSNTKALPEWVKSVGTSL